MSGAASNDRSWLRTNAWVDGMGNSDFERIVYDGETEFRTTTLNSFRASGREVPAGVSWTYFKAGPERIQVKRGDGKPPFILVRPLPKRGLRSHTTTSMRVATPERMIVQTKQITTLVSAALGLHGGERTPGGKVTRLCQNRATACSRRAYQGNRGSKPGNAGP